MPKKILAISPNDSYLFRIFVLAHRLVRGVANRLLDKKYIRPRNFSNEMLRVYAPYFGGKVLNVSGWKDEDGEGGRYKSYFKKATSYFLSNIEGHKKGLGASGGEYQEIELDLLKEIPDNLKNSFDTVFNHTTLEHVYDFVPAFRRVCELSKDVVIIVVPVMQQIHNSEDFGDYWRPTTMAIAKLFKENGLEPLVMKCNDQPFAPIYCFAIASRNMAQYKDKLEKNIDFQMGAYNYGSSLKVEHLLNLIYLHQKR
jgi:hypothetical protein